MSIITIKTNEGIVLKHIARLLHTTFLEATLMIDEKGIFIQEAREGHTVLIEVWLRKEKFLIFKTAMVSAQDQLIAFALGLVTFKENTDGIRKTDSVTLSVGASDTDTLQILTENTQRSKESLKSVKIKAPKIDGITPPIYDTSNPTVTVIAGEFKRVLADAKKYSKNGLRIMSQKNSMRLIGISGIVSGSQETWGNWIEGEEVVYDEIFPTSRISSMIEVAPITNSVRIYAPSPNMPLKFVADAGSIGTISIYIQPGN